MNDEIEELIEFYEKLLNEHCDNIVDNIVDELLKQGVVNHRELVEEVLKRTEFLRKVLYELHCCRSTPLSVQGVTKTLIVK